MSNCRAVRLIVLAALMCPWCLAQRIARGQAQPYMPWSSNYEDVFRSSIDQDSVEIMKAALSLSDAQRQALDSLYERHVGAFDDFVEQHKPIYAHFGKELARRPITAERLALEFEREEKLAGVADRQAAHDQQFLDDARRMLTEAQLESWVPLVQQVDRRRWLRRGSVYLEEPVDLVALLDELAERAGVDLQTPELREILLGYGERIDAPLKEIVAQSITFCRTYYRGQKAYWKWDGQAVYFDSSDDPDRNRKVARERLRVRALHRQIRDINVETRSVIEPLLPAEVQQQFRTEYMNAAFYPVMRIARMPGPPFVERVAKLEDLSAEQRHDIEELAAAHAAAAEAIHQRILVNHSAWQDANSDVGTPPDRRDALRARLEADLESRRAAEATLIDSVWTVLTESQQSRLKKPEIKRLP